MARSLNGLDKLYITQRFSLQDFLPVLSGKHGFAVKNADGDLIYCIEEESNNSMMRHFLGPGRPLTMNLMEPGGRTILTSHRPFCFPCFMEEVRVFNNSNACIGGLLQTNVLVARNFDVFNKDGEVVLKIKGTSCCMGLAKFQIYPANSSNDDPPIGYIRKTLRDNLLLDLFTNVDYFDVAFPRNLDVNLKSLLLMAVPFFDILYYDHDN